VASVAVQLIVDSPQPELSEIPEFGSSVSSLLVAVTESAPVPESVNAIGDGIAGAVTV
jgi:hypothetical protein